MARPLKFNRPTDQLTNWPMNQIPNQGAPISIPMNTLFQLDAMASMLIDAFKTGNNIPNAQKAKLFGNSGNHTINAKATDIIGMH